MAGNATREDKKEDSGKRWTLISTTSNSATELGAGEVYLSADQFLLQKTNTRQVI
jgi:hypothetical protein